MAELLLDKNKSLVFFMCATVMSRRTIAGEQFMCQPPRTRRSSGAGGENVKNRAAKQREAWREGRSTKFEFRNPKLIQTPEFQKQKNARNIYLRKVQQYSRSDTAGLDSGKQPRGKTEISALFARFHDVKCFQGGAGFGKQRREAAIKGDESTTAMHGHPQQVSVGHLAVANKKLGGNTFIKTSGAS
ncbi:MAG TPA: hypothetical protein PLS90_03865 [Candidatus Sumerlaeota bacterium]|nr:hypothetical protein [Candidatus Sumerlaeota bacterium]HOR26823.1 hypothetical protein [Candidatus Sumerlaeota bacterium]HPK01573.1 hypothetical protein [Candidatus Sumerlaeota bacterium]